MIAKKIEELIKDVDIEIAKNREAIKVIVAKVPKEAIRLTNYELYEACEPCGDRIHTLQLTREALEQALYLSDEL